MNVIAATWVTCIYVNDHSRMITDNLKNMCCKNNEKNVYGTEMSQDIVESPCNHDSNSISCYKLYLIHVYIFWYKLLYTYHGVDRVVPVVTEVLVFIISYSSRAGNGYVRPIDQTKALGFSCLLEEGHGFTILISFSVWPLDVFGLVLTEVVWDLLYSTTDYAFGDPMAVPDGHVLGPCGEIPQCYAELCKEIGNWCSEDLYK